MSCNNKEDKEIPMRTISTLMMEKGEMKVKNWAAGAEMMEKEGEMMRWRWKKAR
jgi:hypothetical protein